MEIEFATINNVKIGDKVMTKDIMTCKYTNERTVTKSILSLINREPKYAILIKK